MEELEEIKKEIKEIFAELEKNKEAIDTLIRTWGNVRRQREIRYM